MTKCFSSFIILKADLKSVSSNQDYLETAYQMKLSAIFQQLLNVVGNLMFINFVANLTVFRLEEATDHMVFVLPFLVLYNMAMGLEAIYLGYLYSIVFWLRTLVCIVFFLADLMFFVIILNLKDYLSIYILYAAAGVSVAVWIAFAVFFIVRFRTGKVKKTELSNMKLTMIIGILGFKGLITVAISVAWRYLFYSEVYSVIN